MKTIAKNRNDYIELAYKYANNHKFRNEIKEYIKENKNKVFEEQESVDNWNTMLQDLYNNH